MNEDQEYPPISDYGLIGDMHSCALVSRAGSIDWCCLPRFDSAAVFARILDWHNAGYFKVAPRGILSTSRRYIPGTNVLETTFQTDTGVAKLVDFMPVHPHEGPHAPSELIEEEQMVRFLECESGSVTFTVECFPRFGYGTIVPHTHLDSQQTGFAHGGPDAISLYCSAPIRLENDGYVAEGRLRAGERLWAAVTYESRYSHHADAIGEATLEQRFKDTVSFWQEWASHCTYEGRYREQVLRSALTLKALTYSPSGGLVAAPTTSLPESISGVRNWDYRYTWIRDTTFALYALYILGYTAEARDFKAWLEWSTAGRARDLQIMYGLGGERRLTEIEIPELRGYRRSRPVRVGNAAYGQFQLDIYGEILDSAHLYRKYVGEFGTEYWDYLCRVVGFVIEHWREPDEGIWEARVAPQHFVFSKVMCWVALDRAIKAVRALDLPGDVDLWRKVRREIRQDILSRGFNPERDAFVQAYNSKSLDAAVLMLPLVGFIKATNPRMVSTIRAIERELTSPEGLVYRYSDFDDGLAGDEGAFVICTYWLADNLILLGETQRAWEIFETLLGYANDLGLLSEEIAPATGEMLGNFPQAFSHLGLINTAVQLERAWQKQAADG